MSHLAPRHDKEWLTAAEAAAEALPEFEYKERQIRNLIVSLNISTRKRSGRGGGREFHWSALPVPARDEWLKRYGVQQSANENLPAPAREAEKDLIAEARALIAAAATDFIAARKLTICKGLKAFSAAYERPRTIALDPWVKTTIPKVAPHQIRTWLRALKTGEGASALRDKRGRPEGTGMFDRDAELRAVVIARIAERPHLSAQALCDALRVDLARDIPKRTMQSFMARLRAANGPALKLLANPDKFRSHHQVAFGRRDEGIVRINQRWELDGTRADAMCRLPDGSQRRVTLTGVIDVTTRRAMVVVSDQGSARATQALFRRAILAWGLPEQIKTDNGKDFTAAAVRAFCGELNIAMNFSRPFQPMEKPYIERFFGTLNHGFFPLLPGYVGHNVAERQGIEARNSYQHRFGTEARLVIETTLTPEGLQARLDAWLRDIYEQRAHEGLGLSPAMKALAHQDGVRRVEDERVLDALLLEAPRALCMVNKQGIRIANRYFIAPLLGVMVGQRVHVRFDPHDPGRIVVYTPDRSRFLCVAEDPDITGSNRMQIAVAARREQNAWANEIRADTRKVQRLFPGAGLADRILKDAAGDGFVMEQESARAFEAAGAPTAIEHIRAIEALAESAEPVAENVSAETRATADLILAEFADAAMPSPQRMMQCDGYERPAFSGDDQGFWRWAQSRRAQGLALDTRDAKDIEALAADETFQLQLKIAGQNAAA